jgi:hypothetical protein
LTLGEFGVKIARPINVGGKHSLIHKLSPPFVRWTFGFGLQTTFLLKHLQLFSSSIVGASPISFRLRNNLPHSDMNPKAIDSFHCEPGRELNLATRRLKTRHSRL